MIDYESEWEGAVLKELEEKGEGERERKRGRE